MFLAATILKSSEKSKLNLADNLSLISPPENLISIRQLINFLSLKFNFKVIPKSLFVSGVIGILYHI